MKVTETKDGVTLELSVKPNSKKFELSIEGDEIVVRCTEEPVRGKVNREIIKELSKLFHSRIEIVSGFTSKKKTLLLRAATKNEIQEILNCF